MLLKTQTENLAYLYSHINYHIENLKGATFSWLTNVKSVAASDNDNKTDCLYLGSKQCSPELYFWAP